MIFFILLDKKKTDLLSIQYQIIKFNKYYILQDEILFLKKQKTKGPINKFKDLL
jgi:hypothetical protein